MAEFLNGFAALEPYLERRGEWVLRERGGISIAAGLKEGRVSVLDILEPTPGLLRFMLPMPFRFPNEQRDAAIAALARLNSRAIVAGFCLQWSPPEWGIVFDAYAYLNHDGTISSRVVDAMIATCRATANYHVDELARIVGDTE